MQQRIDDIQEKYRKWCELLPELEADAARWQQAAALMREMQDFYAAEYLDIHHAMENGVQLNLTTQGEYSIMSEDALWNAYSDFQRIAWQRLHSAANALNPEQVQPFDAV